MPVMTHAIRILIPLTLTAFTADMIWHQLGELIP
jgi:hypothetical protein